jgi:DNA-binding IclR family transcriptional regulator
MSRRTPGRHSGARRRTERYTAPALEKGLDILELFAREPRGLTQVEVARRLGRNIGEIFRMLVCLEKRGYISEAAPGDRFELTLKLFELAHRHHPLDRLLTQARPVLHAVAQETGQSCHLAMLSDGQIVVVTQVDAPRSMGFSLRLGAQIDLFDTASGHVILAFQTAAVREMALAAWHRRTGRRIPAGLDEHLAGIRRRGYEKMPSYQVEGVTNISCPIFNRHGETIAAISVPYITHLGERSRQSRVTGVLLEFGARLTAGIGGRRGALLLSTTRARTRASAVEADHDEN